ncbi:MAG: DNA mismatch repair endonuclease MutL [Candidatus Babeliales bacterium]|nr:DNA mismatch repair endonuclease MutL [Candidatus Babeliales bacterium]
MPKIHKLSPHEAQKIAAGEVVERPANIVKELIENAIDAGATAITVYVERGGKDLIRIVDNGCGMGQEDAYLCFEHHATSKISHVEDLQKINTFGFRGEALSSISAVSKVTLITKEDSATEAVKLELEHSIPTVQSFVCGNTGTDLSIRDVFYNVPARRKFLKSDDTEWRAISQLFSAFCLDYLGIQFKLYHNNTLQVNCAPTDDIHARMTQLWEHAFSSNMIPVTAHSNQGMIKISGAISNHQYMRYDRNNIFFFVNKRWVKQQKLSSALVKGYLNVLPPARYPAACIFIEVDPAHVDINIHPRKEEVQFLHPRIVEQLLTQAVKQALEQHVSNQLNKKITFAPATEVIRSSYSAMHGLSFEPIYKIPHHISSASHPAPKDAHAHNEPSLQATLETQPWLDDSVYNEVSDAMPTFYAAAAQDTHNQAPTAHASQPLHDARELQTQTQTTLADAVQEYNTFTPSAPIALEKNYTFIGVMQKTYLLLEKEEGLYVIDQHAAHERILYELFSKRFDSVATISLMFPHCITLKPQDIALLEPHLALFTNNGIGIEVFGDTQITVKSTPVHLKNQSLEDLVHTVIGWINDTQDTDPALFFKTINEKLHAQMACKAAVKAGDSLTQEQIDQLLSDLHAADNRFTCPHGRPTGWLLGTYEIEKKFKRKL